MKRARVQKTAEAPGAAVPSAALGQGKGSARRHRARRTRRGRQRGHDSRAHRTSQPPRVPGRRPARPFRTGRRPRCYCSAIWSTSPSAGEVVIFDRSWYNRAGVEHVMGFCTTEQHRRFLELCPQIEKYMVDGGTILDQALAGSQQRGAEGAIRRPRPRSVAAVETQPDGFALAEALVRLLARARPDAEEDRYSNRPVVHRALGRQADRAAEHHRAPALDDSTQEAVAEEGEAAQSVVQGRV